MIESLTKPDCSWIVSINGGSSSIKFAVYESGDSLQRIWEGGLERIGMPEAVFRVTGIDRKGGFSRLVEAPDHAAAVENLIHWIEDEGLQARLVAVGHHDMPRVAKLLPIPRRYEAQGVRRYGFHGLSYEYLMRELARIAGPEAAQGRIILAHLGNGASLAAVHNGKPVDTSMGFTPASGLVMGTRSGDLDPGLFSYLSRTEGMTEAQFLHIVNHEAGMRGISETDSDMRDLLMREGEDVRASEAIELFCYQTRKWIGSFAAALGGLDTLVFSGGIGEHSPVIRARVCEGLEFLGIDIDENRNEVNVEVISTDAGEVSVRVIPTNEELRIAQLVSHVLMN